MPWPRGRRRILPEGEERGPRSDQLGGLHEQVGGVRKEDRVSGADRCEQRRVQSELGRDDDYRLGSRRDPVAGTEPVRDRRSESRASLRGDVVGTPGVHRAERGLSNAQRCLEVGFADVERKDLGTLAAHLEDAVDEPEDGRVRDLVQRHPRLAASSRRDELKPEPMPRFPEERAPGRPRWYRSPGPGVSVGPTDAPMARGPEACWCLTPPCLGIIRDALRPPCGRASNGARDTSVRRA